MTALPATHHHRAFALPYVESTRPRGRTLSATQERLTLDFDSFFERHYERIVRSLRAAFGADAGVDEAVQDAFVKAHGRWRRVRGYDAPASWVRRVAINKLHDQRRRAERRSRAEQRAWELEQPTTATVIDRSGRLVDLIAELPERQRLAMALHYVEDLPITEVAASMGITEGAVKAHLNQGRSNLAAAAKRAQGEPRTDD